MRKLLDIAYVIFFAIGNKMKFEKYKERIKEIKKLMTKYDGNLTSLIKTIRIK